LAFFEGFFNNEHFSIKTLMCIEKLTIYSSNFYHRCISGQRSFH